MRALNVVPYMTRRRIIDHHTAYSETKCGVKAPTQNRTNNSPNEHYAVDGNRNNDGQLARLSGRVDADGNRSGSGSEPAWQAQTVCFGSAPCVVYQEDRRYADEHRRYEDERW